MNVFTWAYSIRMGQRPASPYNATKIDVFGKRLLSRMAISEKREQNDGAHEIEDPKRDTDYKLPGIRAKEEAKYALAI